MNVTVTLFRMAGLALLGVSLPSWLLMAQPPVGAICLRPARIDPERGPMVNPCTSGNFSLRIDGGPVKPWSKTQAVRITDLDMAAKHRVTIYGDGKPHQSFAFRFSEFKSTELCLFLNDLYHTAQLWDRSPLCKCK
jgi:hypothetical protein